jgi:uncharacterized membrane protein
MENLLFNLIPAMGAFLCVIFSVLKRFFKGKPNYTLFLALLTLLTSITYVIIGDSMILGLIWWLVSLLNYSTYKNEKEKLSILTLKNEEESNAKL